MKKLLGTAVIISMILSGCSDNNTVQPVPETTVPELHTTGIVTEAVITQPAEEKLAPISNGNYIYDNAKILSTEDSAECNNYAGWINSKLMLNTAVVSTDKLNKMTPQKYAEKCYNDIFQGMGSGMILLINNDTNKDYLYKHGTPSLYITEQAEKDAFFYATKSIVTGDYKSGIMEILSLAELCPAHVFDNGSMFTYEQIADIESRLAMNPDSDTFVLTTNNITEKSNSELAKDFFERYSSDGKKCRMLFIDKKLDEIIVMGEANQPVSDKMNQLVKSKDYYGVVKEYLESLKNS